MKKFKRLLAVVLSFLAVVMVGCSFPGEETEEGTSSGGVAGAKALSRAEAGLSDAVGEYSTNFFNLFSKSVMELLYNVYENPTSLSDETKNALFGSTFQHLDGTEGTLDSTGFTYDDYLALSTDTGIYYLIDSIRYTITSASDTTVELSTSSAWTWSVPYASTSYPSIFSNAGLTETGTSSISVYTSYELFMATNLSNLSNFASVYHSSSYAENTYSKLDYYYSPYYDSLAGTSGSINYYQDILEYVTYLTVLGCDTDEDYFDITISKNSFTGVVESVTVGGWESSNVSLSTALANVKSVFESIGEYVGLTDEDRTQIVNFILEEVIGSAATAKDSFSVGGTTYSRNYSEMVARIVDYACTQVATGDSSTLATPFLISQITDYNGSYIFSNEDISSDSTDDTTFEYIDSQEFQSLVVFPLTDDVTADSVLGMVGLLFEYGNDDGVSGKTYAESITINVGVRFYSHSSKAYVDYGSEMVTIEQNASSADSSYIISTDEKGFMSNLVQLGDINFSSEELADGRIEGCFNTSVGSDAINALKNGTFKAGTGFNIATMKITGSSSAKDYYKVSRDSNGTKATLEESKFSDSDGCDFFEIYFQVQKSGTLSEIASTNYNFKVALWSFSFDDGSYSQTGD